MGEELLFFGVEASFPRPGMSPAHFPKVKEVGLSFLGFKLLQMILQVALRFAIDAWELLTNCELVTN